MKNQRILDSRFYGNNEKLACSSFCKRLKCKKMKKDIITAHNYSSNHRDQILKSDLCGCFYCVSIFHPKEITEWVDEWAEDGKKPEGQTALCPKCGIDSVLGSASGYPIEMKFLLKMKDHFFDK